MSSENIFVIAGKDPFSVKARDLYSTRLCIYTRFDVTSRFYIDLHDGLSCFAAETIRRDIFSYMFKMALILRLVFPCKLYVYIFRDYLRNQNAQVYFRYYRSKSFYVNFVGVYSTYKTVEL